MPPKIKSGYTRNFNMHLEDNRTKNLVAWIVFAVASACVISLQVVLFSNAGAFWRDEVSSIALAKLPTFFDVASSLERDSFPAFFVSILHLSMKSGLITTDAALRFFGTLIFLSTIAALCLNARLTKSPPPLLALALLAFNAMFFYYGSSIRAYGLAAALIIILFGCVWKVVEHPTMWRILAAAFAAILNVQTSYQSLYLVPAVFTAGIITCIMSGRRRHAAILAGIGVVSMLSVLFYLPVIASVAQWENAQRVPIFKFSYVFEGAFEAMGAGSYLLLLIWLNLFLIAVFFSIWRLLNRVGDERERPDIVFYSFFTLLAAWPAFIFFVKYVGRWTYAWQCLPLMALQAAALDSFFGETLRRRVYMKALLSVLIVLVSVPSLWQYAHTRRTNVDLVAKRLLSDSKANDLVLVNPFWNGISFKYYYRGDAPWETLPFIRKDRVEDPVREIIQLEKDPQAAQETSFGQISRTLKGGGRLWVAEGHPYLPSSDQAREIAPAPHPLYGWYSGYYAAQWSANAWLYIRTHAEKVQRVSIPMNQQVSRFEDISLYMAEGWRK